MARAATFAGSDVARAALAVAEAEGWDAITVRSVAAALGVTPMALYRLMDDASDLRRLAADLVGAHVPPVTGELVQSLCRWAALAYHELHRFRGIGTYLLTDWTELPSWLAIVEGFLSQALADGLDGSAAVAVVNSVFAYTLVRVHLAHAPSMGEPRRLGLIKADPSRYPAMAANLDEFTVAQTERHFLFGLGVLIRGLTGLPADHQLF